MASIIVTKGKSRGNYLPLRAGTFVLGRDEDCDLQVQGDAVSRHHLEIRGDDEGDAFIAVDTDSVNGVYVNRQRIEQQTPLADGDMVGIGDSELLFTARDFLDRAAAMNFFQRGEHAKSTVIR